jgi:hypothetical protein
MRMRIIVTFSVIILLSICTSSTLLAQPDTTAIATAKAKIVKPVSATQSAQLRFGNCRSQNAPGTVTIDAQTDARSFAGNASGNGGMPIGAASFSVSGEPGLNFSVSLPSVVTISSSVNVTNFTQYAASYTLNSLGSGSFKVGGRLNLPTTASFANFAINVPITVNYQ